MKKQGAPIRVKRVYDPPEASDGTRVLVDRLWPRGLRKENSQDVVSRKGERYFTESFNGAEHEELPKPSRQGSV